MKTFFAIGKFLFLVLFVSFVVNVGASNVTFNFVNFLNQSITNVTLYITPLSLQTNGTGAMNFQDMLVTNSANSSSIILDNVISNYYSVREGSSYFTIAVPNDTASYNATNLIVGFVGPNLQSIWTRAQSDSRYLQLSNGSTPEITFTGLEIFHTNEVSPDATNTATFTTNAAVTWPTPILTNTCTNVTISIPGIGTNGDWECDVTPCLTVMKLETNLTFTAWVSATNTVTIEACNNGSGQAGTEPNEVNVAGNMRLVLRQWR